MINDLDKQLNARKNDAYNERRLRTPKELRENLQKITKDDKSVQ